MGTRGPVPKRDDQRAGHRAKSERARKLKTSDVLIPEPREEWHPAARDVFDAASLSPVSGTYDSASWAMLVLLCDLLDTHYTASRPSAEMFKHAMGLSARLLLTPADQLRARIEVTAPTGDEDPADVGDIEKRFAALAGDNA
jgi:hypothetical protein